MGHWAMPPPLLSQVLHGAEEERSAQATLAAWHQYRHACELRLHLDPPAPGPVCNRSFDMYACWGDAVPNTTVTVPCPWYLPWHHRVQGGVVARHCGPDGRWVLDETGRPWRDHSQCQDPAQEQPLQRQAWLLEQFRLLYTVGYSLSLVALLLALLLLLTFRRLHCTRNFIHANLFLSFVLRAGAILTRDALLRRRLRPGPAHPLQLVGQEAVASCRLAQVVTQYCVGANYGWLLAEGLFLHKLLVLVAFSGRRCLPAFLLLGWGAPVLFVVPWVVARYLYENEGGHPHPTPPLPQVPGGVLPPPVTLGSQQGAEVTLQLLFLDGEEAFGDWSATDSLYGARHLAAQMATTRHGPHGTQLTAMSLLVLLDLLGARHPAIHSHFTRTHHWFLRLVAIEQRLRRLGLLHAAPQDQPFFRLSPAPGPVEDDHVPFLQRGVPILHLIPTPFPRVWHTLEDTEDNLHPPTVEDLCKILVTFVAEFLQL
ncbi:gastric inhibitory polypeptide receptor [Falco cherrug]|uniref:gastric inhibitory polypeptide receptor n=1 Tax=Falco cherrug TaxID=345164 RepID=UPI002479DE9C|nr:gastric inhibitory polypeptide receptor [Falco cherrug]